MYYTNTKWWEKPSGSHPPIGGFMRENDTTTQFAVLSNEGRFLFITIQHTILYRLFRDYLFVPVLPIYAYGKISFHLYRFFFDFLYSKNLVAY